MAKGSSGKGTGIVGKKKLGPNDVNLVILNKYDRPTFFQKLQEFGWSEVESPFEFECKWPEKKIRKAAKEHAADVFADLLIEVRDRDFSTNPHNDYVFYVWRSGPNTRGLPPRPQQMSQLSMHQQMLQQQQVALFQQQQMLQRMQAQAQTQAMPQVQQPAGVPAGQTCARCGGNQIQYMANGMAKCIRCGFSFQWQAGGQPAPGQGQPQSQPQPQPTIQPVQPVQPVQPQQAPSQMPNVKPPVQPGAPVPPGSRPCPKCGAVLTIFPDGSFLCNKCGHTGK